MFRRAGFADWQKAGDYELHSSAVYFAKGRNDFTLFNPAGTITAVSNTVEPNWQVESAVLQTLAALPADAVVEERITLGKLVMDLHTGKVMLGKSAEWVGIELLDGIWVFPGFTGLWMWWKSQTKRRDTARGRIKGDTSHG